MGAPRFEVMMRAPWLALLLAGACKDDRVDALVDKQSELEHRLIEVEAALESMGERVARAERVARRREAIAPDSSGWIRVEDDRIVVVRDGAPQGEALERLARIVPAEHGVRIRRVRPESPFARMGFENGDVVVSLDGAWVDPDLDVHGFLETLLAEDSVRIDVDRRGSPASWTVYVE